MKRSILVTILTVGALAVAAVAVIPTARSVYAQATTPTPGQPAQQNSSGQPAGKGQFGSGDQSALADALGITTDQLSAAYQKANEAAISKALADGKITQQQADDLRSRNTGGRMMGGRGMSWSGVDYDQLLADALGISKADLTAAKDKVFQAQLAEAVSSGRITQEQADQINAQRALYASSDFQSSMQSAFEAAVKQAVSNGVITQAQADQILANPPSFGGRGFGMGHGGMFGGHGRGGMRGSAPSTGSGSGSTPSTPTQTAPTGSNG